MVLMYKIKNNKYSINVLFAVLCTIIIFGVFVGQALTSSVITFSKNGDGHKQCFAAFMKIRECFINKESFIGVDSGSFNGATEFFLRPNMPGAYIFFYLFAMLSVLLPARGMYILLYAFHMFAALFVMQKLCKKYFGLNNKIAMVVSSLYLYLLCVGSWYVSYFIIISLTIILFYFSLETYYNRCIRTSLQLVLGVVLSLTSGYITVAVAMLIFVYILSMVYICSNTKDRELKYIIKNTVLYFVGGCITVPWLLQMYIYTDKVVGAGTSIVDTISLSIKMSDIFNIISDFSFEFSKPLENISMISLGMISCFTICYAIKDKVIRKISQSEKIFVFFTIFTSLFIIIWSCGSSTAVAGFLYNLLPILGGMHLQNRYLMIVLPFLYIAIGKLVININWSSHKKSIKMVACIIIIIMFLYLLLMKLDIQVSFVKENQFLLEVMLTLLFIYFVQGEKASKKKYLGRGAAIIWISSQLIISSAYLYQSQGVYTSLQDIENRSIIYNGNVQVAIDNFITNTKPENKNVYRIVSYDSKESVPNYLIGNYEWFNFSNFDLCNYSGYEIHLCVPQDYRQHNPWFNNYDWEYLINTRADYMMTDYETINADREFFDKVIDWDRGVADIGNGRIMVKLFQFIPSNICGTEYKNEDNTDSLDNGYFYSHDLKNDDVISFDTDQNSYYELSVGSDNSSLLAFLPYANRNYHYYIDSVEVTPDIVNMQAILFLESGNHVIRIVYENTMGTIGFWLIIVSGVLLIISIVFLQVITGRKKKNERKN